MAGLGTYLSHLREERGLSIEELARVTRVSPRFLEALEREDFAALPVSVFTKGHIRACCQALGVPVDEALSRYGESAGLKIPVPAAPVAAPGRRSADDGRRSRGTLLLSFVLLVGFGVALFAVALFLQSGRPEIGAHPTAPPAPSVEREATTDTARSSEAPATAPEPKATREIPTPTAAPVAGPRPTESKPAPPVEPRLAVDASRAAAAVDDPPSLQLGSVMSPYRLVARTVEATWLRVRTEDGRATEETIPAGEEREWISNRPFVVTIGNAAGVALELNGHTLPPLGERGAVIRRLILPPAEP